jgi:hypothetical protein
MKYLIGFLFGTLFWATVLYTIKIPECIIMYDVPELLNEKVEPVKPTPMT